jgi:hypothetical protein
MAQNANRVVYTSARRRSAVGDMDDTVLDSLVTTTLTGLLVSLVFGQFIFSAAGLIIVTLVSLFLIYRDRARPVSLLMFEVIGYTCATLLGFYMLRSAGVRVEADVDEDAVPMTAMLSYNLIALWLPSRARYEFVFRWATGLPSGPVKIASAAVLFAAELVIGFFGYSMVNSRWIVAVIGFGLVSFAFSCAILVAKVVLSVLRKQ